jgi:cell division protein FtsW
VGVIAILVMLQPDLGTTMVIVAIVFLLVFVSGVKWRPLAATLFLGSATGLMLIMSAAYRRERFLSFLHPWADPKNTGYQIVQSLLALGSGHWLGVGIGASRQKWMFVPNAHTDFIFAIMGEETGLVGEIVVLVLFAAFIFAGIRIAMKAPDIFGRLLAAGITGWIAFQAIVNMGSVTGLLPITGVPLPFVSYGGSSLVVSLMAVGVLVSIGRATLEAASGSRPASRRKVPVARDPVRSRATEAVRSRARESARAAGHPAGTEGRGR